ncbi:serine/threonine-protein kinase-like protein At1g28390 isoform X2 [Durio zibethinus]|uniref:Serine/threonine-protein kinase-like protein At1g28390 isoform X2 n=1 Tax=Durio zibethinus TaxID=66656 RepID=A0A6P6B5U9_DURZI|nr:serine/threonine-protein kinase-like protein At1g28390 isoform X2 [Durio zibethinus]
MGYFSCNAESAVGICDPYNWDYYPGRKSKKNKPRKTKNHVEIRQFLYADLLSATKDFSSDSFLGKGSHGSVYKAVLDNAPGWSRRVRFALQVAKAVQALHSANPPVIHRDIKSSNVLIDQKWNARLGDFGLALRGHMEDVRVKCTPPAGTLGYLDPGYLAPSDVSTKSDVFSYGILLLEIISGRHAIDLNYSPPSVVDWAIPLIKGGYFAAVCDDGVGPPMDKEVIRSLAMLAARCVRSTAEKRPGMGEVVEFLKVVRKRIHSGPVWSNLRPCMERLDSPLVKNQVFEGSEEVVTSSRCGSRRNSRKVSSVTSVDHDSEVNGDRVVRSKSIDSIGEAAMMMKMEPTEIDLDGDQVALVRKKPEVTVKMPVVKLIKSRSMGVLQSPRLMNQSSKKYLFEIGKRRNSNEFDISKLVISFNDEQSERKMSEKPLCLV